MPSGAPVVAGTPVAEAPVVAGAPVLCGPAHDLLPFADEDDGVMEAALAWIEYVLELERIALAHAVFRDHGLVLAPRPGGVLLDLAGPLDLPDLPDLPGRSESLPGRSDLPDLPGRSESLPGRSESLPGRSE